MDDLSLSAVLELGQSPVLKISNVLGVSLQVQRLVVNETEHDAVPKDAVAREHPPQLDRSKCSKDIDHVAREGLMVTRQLPSGAHESIGGRINYWILA